MTSVNFSYIRVELPVEDSDGRITRTAPQITAALSDTTQLRQMLAFAHTLAEALDGIATEVALLSGHDPDSDVISQAVYTETDVDAAMAVLMDRPEGTLQ